MSQFYTPAVRQELSKDGVWQCCKCGANNLQSFTKCQAQRTSAQNNFDLKLYQRHGGTATFICQQPRCTKCPRTW